MLKQNPLYHALAAAVYIVLIVFVIQSFSTYLADSQETILIPITMLSLLTLSAAIMGFIFFAEPVSMFIQGQKQEAINFFLKTLLYFAFFAAISVGLLFYTR